MLDVGFDSICYSVLFLGRLEAPGLEARHKRNNVCGRTLGAPPRAVSPKAWLCCIIAEAKGRREEKSAQTPTRPAPCRLARNQGQSQGPISHCPAVNVRVDVVRVLIFPFVHHDGVGVSAKKKNQGRRGEELPESLTLTRRLTHPPPLKTHAARRRWTVVIGAKRECSRRVARASRKPPDCRRKEAHICPDGDLPRCVCFHSHTHERQR
jgi:hypothetical protein